MQDWFEYPLRVHPHHTDYAGVVWHGTYLTWLEEARVECLQSVGIAFADLVAMDCDLPVVGMQLRYHRAVRMGQRVVIRSRLVRVEKIRLSWEQQVYAAAVDGAKVGRANLDELYFSAQVELVPVNRTMGRVLRRLPPLLQTALARLEDAYPEKNASNIES